MFKKLFFCVLVAITSASAQVTNDSTLAPGYRPYSSIGFNLSSVSGLGLSYRNHLASPSQFQLTAGIVSSKSSTSYSVGFEYQYQLSKKDSFRYFIATGVGVYSGTTSTTAAGLGIGLELPIIGTTIYESVTAGADLFYPVLYSGNESLVSFGGSLYIFYNF